MPVSVSRRWRLALTAALLVSLAGLGGNAIATADPNVITRSGSTLMLHGHAYRFTGVNAYELGTYWSVNAGCGAQLSDAQLDAFFAGLRPDSVVRFWAFQAQAVNRVTHRIDYTGLDRVFRAAERHNQRLLPVLGSQDGTCDDGHWRDRTWYTGGYRLRFNDDHRGLNPLAYATWVAQTVQRYKASPSLGMWELINEPEASNCVGARHGHACYGHQNCPPTAAADLRGFFDAMGATVKRLDPKHLLVSGVIGGTQCSVVGDGYSTVHASAYIDVATYHDYGRDTEPVPGDAASGMATRIKQAKAVGKPMISEEVGISSSPDNASGCVSRTVRAGQLGAKLHGQVVAGSRGFLVWNYGPTATPGCSPDVTPNDPTMTLLKRATI